jgi:hypothetical protein
VSKLSRAGSFSSAVNIVGTPANTVAPSRSISSSSLSGAKRGSRVNSAPLTSAAFMTLFMPNTWKSGNVATVTSSGPMSTSSRAVEAPAARVACVSVAPFGVPVVPDV